MELLYLQLTTLAFDLQLELFCLPVGAFLLTVGKSVSTKGLKGLQAKKLNCKQKSSNCKYQSFPVSISLEIFNLDLGSPPAWQRSQNPPLLKMSKKSLRESLRGGLRGSWPTPPNQVKNESPESKKQVILDSQSLQETLF